MAKKGYIVGVHNLGSIWQIAVSQRISKGLPSGNITIIQGDWRPMSEGLKSAFGDKVIGQQIRYVPDPVFGASRWEPTGLKKKLKGVI